MAMTQSSKKIMEFVQYLSGGSSWKNLGGGRSVTVCDRQRILDNVNIRNIQT